MDHLIALLAKIFIGLVAAEHLFILWFEMFAWETAGKKIFRGAMPDELFRPTKKLAANQGLYNGFLAAGLIWSFFIEDSTWQHNVAVFFLGCVIAAGTYGALSASRRIFMTQALPAIIALLLVLFA